MEVFKITHSVTFTFNSRLAMIVTYASAKSSGRRSVHSVGWNAQNQTNGRDRSHYLACYSSGMIGAAIGAIDVCHCWQSDTIASGPATIGAAHTLHFIYQQQQRKRRESDTDREWWWCRRLALSSRLLQRQIIARSGSDVSLSWRPVCLLSRHIIDVKNVFYVFNVFFIFQTFII